MVTNSLAKLQKQYTPSEIKNQDLFDFSAYYDYCNAYQRRKFMDSQNESIGFLIVETTTANGAFPVEDALIYVYPSSDNGAFPSDLSGAIYSLRSDSSGRSDKIALKTKPRSLSEAPNNESPFLSYNIYVKADGFYDSQKLNVPIFQGITSIQPVLMIPLSEYASPDSATPDSIGRSSYSVEPNL
jgi:hypothetical protein